MEIRKFDDQDWIRLVDMCDILRYVMDPVVFEDSRKVVMEIMAQMFFEDLEKGETVEMPGDFIVGYHNNGVFSFYSETRDGVDLLTSEADKTMHFALESEAKRVAERLSGKTEVAYRAYSVSPMATALVRRHLNKMYGCKIHEEGENV